MVNFFHLVRKILLLLSVAALPALSMAVSEPDSTLSWTPSPVERGFAVNPIVILPRSSELLEMDIMRSALSTISYLALNRYHGIMPQSQLIRSPPLNIEWELTQEKRVLRPWQVRYAMWALDACIVAYRNEGQPWYKTQCKFGFERDRAGIGYFIWRTTTEMAASNHTVESRQESPVAINRRAQSDLGAVRTGPDDTLEARDLPAGETGPMNTTSPPNRPETAAGQELASEMGAIVGDTAIDVSVEYWGGNIGRIGVFRTIILAVIDRASKQPVSQYGKVNESYTFSSQETQVEIQYRPIKDGLFYASLIQGLVALPTYMYLQGGLYKECTFTIKEDGNPVGHGAVRKVR